MSETIEVRVPDLGDVPEVDVVEVLVSPGDAIRPDDGLITLESDKASMDVPSPRGGVVRRVRVSRGDKVSAGTVILDLETQEEDGAEEEAARPAAEEGGEKAGSAPAEEAPRQPEAPAAAPSGPAAGKGRGEADEHAPLVVLGAGPGGYTAAFRAADLGVETVLVERYPDLGGVCLNVGCIPSKALLHVAKVIAETAELGEHGVAFGEPRIDLDALRSWKEEVVGRLTGGLARLARQRRVRVVQGTARFTSPHTLEVETADGTRTISFDKAIVAAGSRVIRLPGIPYDDPRVMGSAAALEIRDVPRRLLVVGGGIIGLEMATVYDALGSKITVVELTDGLLPGVDRDLVRPLQRRIARRYEAIYLETKVTRIDARKEGLEACFEGGKAPASATFDKVLVAVGRRPNGDRIGAEAAGIRVTDRGFIPVDEHQRTNVAHIFAIGDLVGPPMLAHKATHEGKVAAEVAAGGKSAFDARVIPSVAYTDPEVAWVGVTEGEAEERGLDVGKGSFPWSASGRALGLGRGEGLTKLLFDERTGRVLGAGIVGPGAGDLIAEVALAVEMDCEAEDIGLTVHPHPTLSETVAFSAEAFAGTLTDLYLPKRGR